MRFLWDLLENFRDFHWLTWVFMGFHGLISMVDLLMGKSRISAGFPMGFVGTGDGFKGKSQGIWMQS